MVSAPRIDSPRLVDLQDSTGALLRAGGSFEGDRYAHLDLTDRDLTDAAFSECEFSGVTLVETLLRGASVLDVTFANLNAVTLSAPRSRWRDVSIRHSRIGAGELYETEWNGVEVEASRLGYLNFRGAELRDVLFSRCRIDELDLGGASAMRVAFVDCQIGTLDLTGARLTESTCGEASFAR